MSCRKVKIVMREEGERERMDLKERAKKDEKYTKCRVGMSIRTLTVSGKR